MIIDGRKTNQIFEYIYKQDRNDVRWMKCSIHELPDGAGFIVILRSYNLSESTDEKEKLKFHDVKSASCMSDIMKEASNLIDANY